MIKMLLIVTFHFNYYTF